MSVQINGDWETVKVDNLATTGTYAEYIMNLENSFSEPLLKATHFHWYTMLTKGYGRVRSYGKPRRLEHVVQHRVLQHRGRGHDGGIVREHEVSHGASHRLHDHRVRGRRGW